MKTSTLAVLAAGAAALYFVTRKGGFSLATGPSPVTGARTPPSPAAAATGGAPVGANPTNSTAQLIGTVGSAVKDVAGAFTSIWDTLSTSQDSPSDPAPATGSSFDSTAFDPTAGDSTFDAFSFA